MGTVLLFPGQGLQHAGMGRSLAEAYPQAREVFAQADEALGFSLSRLCFAGTDDDLLPTAVAQPAILTHALAAFRVVQAEAPVEVAAAAGHSLGEWTALVAAGVLDLADAVRLVHLRGRFMQEAVPAGLGAMTAILGLEREVVAALCAEAAQGEVVAPATHNGRSHVVVSGHRGAVERVAALAIERGAHQAMPLPVSAPFHCPLMTPAADKLAEALADVKFSTPRFPVRSTIVDAAVTGDDTWRGLLVEQMTAPVLWAEAIEALAGQGHEQALALGPGKALAGMVKRIARGLKVTVVGEAADVERLVPVARVA